MPSEIGVWAGRLASLVLAGYVGSLFALRRTMRERQWQARYDAYHTVLRALEDVRAWASETYAAEMHLPAASDLEALRTRYEAAKRTLEYHFYVAELLIAEQARQAIARFITELVGEEIMFQDYAEGPEQMPTVLAKHAAYIRDTIIPPARGSVMAAAEADLKLFPWTRRFAHNIRSRWRLRSLPTVLNRKVHVADSTEG